MGRGRPRQRWQADVMEYLKKLKEKKNRKETAKDRRTWRGLAEKAKTHKGLLCQMMMNNILYIVSTPTCFSAHSSPSGGLNRVLAKVTKLLKLFKKTYKIIIGCCTYVGLDNILYIMHSTYSKII